MSVNPSSIGGFLKKNWGAMLNGGVGVISAGDTFFEQREKGNGIITSAAAAGMDFALPMMMGTPAYIAMQVASSAPSMALEGYTAYRQYSRQLAREARGQAFANAKFDDTQQAYTMRQAGMAIAQRSKYNISQAMLGNEAKYMAK